MEYRIGEWVYTPQLEQHDDGRWELTLILLKKVGFWHEQYIIAEMQKHRKEPVRLQVVEPFVLFVQEGRTDVGGGESGD